MPLVLKPTQYLLVLIITLIIPNSATAFYSSEPIKPYCVDGSGYFDDQYQFSSCKSEVESYASQVSDYVSCLRDEQNEQIEQSNKVIEQFNCRAEGQSYCY